MTETRITNETTGGEKGQKLERFDLIPAGPMEAVARHYGIGARKYDDDNWRKGYSWRLSLGALERHLYRIKGGEDIDEETQSPHAAAIVFHALALLEFAETHPELDDRWRPEMPKVDVKKIFGGLDAQTMSFTIKDFNPESMKLFWGGPLPKVEAPTVPSNSVWFTEHAPKPAPSEVPTLKEILEQIRELRMKYKTAESIRMPQIDWDRLKLSVRPQLSDPLYDALDSSSRLFGLDVIIDDSFKRPTVMPNWLDGDPVFVDTNEMQPDLDKISRVTPKRSPKAGKVGRVIESQEEYASLPVGVKMIWTDGETVATRIDGGWTIPGYEQTYRSGWMQPGWTITELPAPPRETRRRIGHRFVAESNIPASTFKPGGILEALHGSLNHAGIVVDEGEENEADLRFSDSAVVKIAQTLEADGIIPVRNAAELKTAAGADRASVREILRATDGRNISTYRHGFNGRRIDDVFEFEHDDLVQLLDILEDAGLEITHIPTQTLTD